MPHRILSRTDVGKLIGMASSASGTTRLESRLNSGARASNPPVDWYPEVEEPTGISAERESVK